MRDLTQMNKLEEYLKEKGIPYQRIDDEGTDEHGIVIRPEHHQIYVCSKSDYKWDAICHRGSYGCEDGLLEIMGEIVPPTADDIVEGWLTAEDVIDRIETKA